MSPEALVQTVLACSQCGRAFAHSDLVQIAGNWVCADCKPAFLSRVMASGAAGASPLAWRYGGFWIRFGARFIDGLIFTLRAKGHPIRRPQFELGRMLWALLHVECCYQRHSLHKYRPHAG